MREDSPSKEYFDVLAACCALLESFEVLPEADCLWMLHAPPTVLLRGFCTRLLHGQLLQSGTNLR